jgi:hypothetical protein
MANEKRLIDANALKKRLDSLEASGGHKYYRKGMDDTLHFHMPNIIDEAPTVDAVEVVHGEWEKQQGIYSCSICGKACPYDVQADIIQYWICNYCPNCGADMTRGAEDG